MSRSRVKLWCHLIFLKALASLCFLLALSAYQPLAHAAPALADRLILDVNKKSYSQRHMEIYLALKKAMQSVDDKTFTLPKASEWSEQINEFLRDALVDQEALRLNTFQPTGRMIAAGEQLIAVKRARLPDLHRYLLRLGTDRRRIREVLASVLRVKGFIRMKDKNIKADDIPIEGVEIIDPNAEWYANLEKRVPYRVYEEGRVYKELSVPPASTTGN